MKKAIALSYEEQMAAPKVVAKGSEIVAERILEEAIRHNIPIRQDQTLVTLLDAIEVSEQVPPEQLRRLVALPELLCKRVTDRRIE